MDNSGRPIQRACLFCRKRKLRCDKQLPRCQSCTRLGQECTYVSQRFAQHRPRTERNHVQELEERLRRVESLLGASLPVPDGDDRSPPSDLGHEDNTMNESNCAATPLKTEIIRDLEKIYFETIYPIMPIMHYERYHSCQILNTASWPPLYLRYAICAVAAIGVKQHHHQSSEYYTKARNLTEAAALTDPRCTQSALCRAQAWLHLAMHDMMCGRFALVWTNTSQAIRLLQIAKVHNLDTANASSNSQNAKNDSWSEAEERRRAFWFAFCMDRSAFIGQGLPRLIDEKDIHVNLPASDKAYQSSTEQPAMTLSQTALGSADILSPLSAAAVVYSLCSSTLKDLQNLDSTSVHKLFATNDWMQRNSLCNSLTTVFCVPPYFAATKDNLDANLLYLNVIIHCATLQVHRMVQKLARTSPSPLAARFIHESNTQCLKAASAIFELAQLASQSKIRNYHPATFFCIYNALVVFADCFLVKRDPKLSIPITALIDFMKFLCDQSQVARILFRDFETEYPSLILELSSENQKTPTQMDVQEPRLPFSQGGVPAQPKLAKNMPSTSAASDDGEEWSSYVTEPIPYDIHDALSWNDQVTDMEFASLF